MRAPAAPRAFLLLAPLLTIFGLVPSLVPSLARAQSATWLVLPIEVQGQPSSAVDVASRVRAAVSAGGAGVVSPEAAAQVIRGELPPSHHEAPAGLIERIREGARQLRGAIHAQRYPEVIEEAGGLLSDALPHIAAINREERSARDLADLCGYMVQANLAAGDEASVELASQYCLRLNPELLLEAGRHSSEAQQRIEQARQSASAQLSVHLPEDAPECVIRLNGAVIGLGVTVPAGDYVLQTECDEQPGPWRRLHLAEGENVVTVNALELFARADPEVLLSYSASSPERLPHDAAQLARLVTAAHVLTVEQTIEGVSLRAFRIDAEGAAHPTGQTTVVADDEANIGVGVRGLLGGDVTGRGGSALQSAGIALLAVGGAAIVAGAITGGVAISRQGSVQAACPEMRCVDPAALDDANNMVGLANLTDGLLFGGGAIALTGLVLLLLDGGGGSGRGPTASLSCTGEGCVGSLEGSF